MVKKYVESMDSDPGFVAALEEAWKSAAEGGIPIGACLVDRDGKILGRGHNMRVQKGSATLHLPELGVTMTQGEISALENSGRLPASAYKGATMYTTLSPCDMCTGACVLYKVSRVVIGENANFVGGEEYLRQKGIEVVNLKNKGCEEMMAKFIKEHPEIWYEDIGEDE